MVRTGFRESTNERSPNDDARINFIRPADKDEDNAIGVAISYVRIFLVFTNSNRFYWR